MAALAFGAIGAAIGGTVAPGVIAFGMTGASLGWTVGQFVGNALFPPDMGNVQGPRLSDLKVQSSTMGGSIPLVYGSARIAGNVIWSTDLVETSKTTGGGKGGGGGPSQTSYTYTVSLAIGLCEGEIVGVRRIWANKELVFDAGATSVTQIIANSLKAASVTVYTGSETQQPDPTIQADKGAADTPAYRGLAYVVLKDLQLEEFGNRTPQLEFEVVRQGTFGGFQDLGWDAIQTPSPDGYVRAPYNPSGSLDGWESYASESEGGMYVVRINSSVDFSSTNDGVPMILGVEGNAIRVLCCDAMDIPSYPFDGKYSFDYLHSNNYSHLIDVETGAVLAREPIGNIIPNFVGNFIVPDPIGAPTTGYTRQVAGFIRCDSDPLYPIRNFYVQDGYIGGALIGDYSTQFPIIVGGNISMFHAELVSAGYSGKYLIGVAPSADWRRLYAFMSDDFVPPNDTSFTMTHWAAFEMVSGGDLTLVDSGGFDASWNFNAGGAERLELAFSFWGSAPVRRGHDHSAMVESSGSKLWIAKRSQTYLSAGIVVAELNVSNNWTLSSSNAASGWDVGVNGLQSIYADRGAAIVCTNNKVFRYSSYPSLTAGQIALSEIVSDLCDRSGLAVSEYDVTELTDLVDGYVVGQRMPARRAIEPLQAAFFFDGVESDKKLKFPKRGRSVSATFTEDDLAAHDGNPAELPDQLARTRAQEMELPREMTISYFSKEGDYQEGTQYDRRLITSAVNVASLPLPIVMSDQKAAQVASVNLHGAWLSREAFQWTSDRSYAMLDPSDVAMVNKGGRSWKVRITKRTEGANGVINWEGVQEDTTAYSQVGAYSITNAGMQQLFVPSSTALKVMDTYSLRDSESYSPQVYLAASGYGSNWKGAWLYVSKDGGVTYDPSSSVLFKNSAAIGTALDALPAPGQFGIFDETNSVTVQLFDKNETLDSATEAQVLLGANALYLGGEILQFKNASLVGEGMYVLSGLLRGRKGSERHAYTHTAGEDFALLSTADMQTEPLEKAYIGSNVLMKPLSFGATSLSSVVAKNLTFNANNMRPLAPVYVNGYQDSTGNWTIEWKRRTRRGGEWIDGTDAELGEESESYVVEIWTSGFASLVRTLTSSSPTAAYSSADQTTDFGAVQTRLAVKVFQVSAVAGRGEEAATYVQIGSASVDDKFSAFTDMVERLNPLYHYSCYDNFNLSYAYDLFPSVPRSTGDLGYTTGTPLTAYNTISLVGGALSKQEEDGAGCAYFDGVDDYARFPSTSYAKPDGTLGFSSVMVVKPQASVSGRGFWTFSNAANTTNQYTLAQVTTTTNLTYNSASSTTQSTVVATGAIENDAWNFFATTHAAGAVGTLTAAKIFKNGVLANSGTLHSPQNVTRDVAYLMASYTGATTRNKGHLACFADWKRELTTEEIRKLKTAWDFGASPSELKFRTSRVAIGDGKGKSASRSSGFFVEYGSDSADNMAGNQWANSGAGSIFSMGPDNEYVAGSGKFTWQILVKLGDDVTTRQCLLDIGSVIGTSGGLTAEENSMVRKDGLCLFLEGGVLKWGLSSNTVTAGAISYRTYVSGGATVFCTPGQWLWISIRRNATNTIFTVIDRATTSSVQGHSLTTSAINYTADKFSIGNFDPDIGPGDFPFLGKICKMKYWVGIDFDPASFAAL